MIQHQLKLRLTKAQEQKLETWLFHLTAVWNFAVRKIELNARDRIYFSEKTFQNVLAGHSKKLGIPSHTLGGLLATAHRSWVRCFKGLSRKPRLKGARRPLNSIPFPDAIRRPEEGKVSIPALGKVRFHKQWIPEGKIKCGRICKRASGWYLCLFIDAEPQPIPRTAEGVIGIDPGFKTLLTLSTGEKLSHPREFRAAEKRLGQAQRGKRKKLATRLHERVKNRRQDRNHKLSRRLVAENTTICFLKDNHRGIANRFGKSVSDAAHGQLRQQLSYKSLIGGANLVFPENRNSTRACSTCGALYGPTGLAGLKLREWDCGVCGTHHDRDTNSARNALIFGAGTAHEVASCL
jgi:putative transposase